MSKPLVIDLIVGCRPNFVKAAAILHAAKSYPDVKINLVHTGQHTSDLSDPFFYELDLPIPPPNRRFICPVFNNPVARLARIVEWLGEVFEDDKPDVVMVVGDTDSTLAGALAAAKLNICLVHVEAGLRCGDMMMQEELNRRLVDSVSDICYTTTEAARETLIAEGHNPELVKFVGNVMVDTLYRLLPDAEKRYQHGWESPYAVLTLHRAETVDHNEIVFPLLDTVRKVAESINVIWPVHPRIRSRIGAWKCEGQFARREPMGYLKFISLLASAKFVMTDSGGVQEETTALGIPCLTLRPSTERPETVSMGSNYVVGINPGVIYDEAMTTLAGRHRDFPNGYGKPPLWDGHAADRILADIVGRNQ